MIASADGGRGFVEVERLTKRFDTKRSISATYGVKDVSLRVAAGEMVALLGPSGSGKTTLLRCIAGLEHADSGEIVIAGRLVFSAEKGVSTAPAERNIGLIFQTYALWPHMTVRQNVEYPLARRGAPRAERAATADMYLEMVDCDRLAERYPHEISGGQQQRIALARSLVYEPSLILFDEPLSNLDAALREQLRYQIRELQGRLGFTGIYVTHDQREAFLLADRVALISSGQIVQFDTPDNLYREPRSPEVAEFLGASNSVTGVVRVVGGQRLFTTADGQSIDVSDVAGTDWTGADGRARLMVRPDGARVRPEDGGSGLPASVADAIRVGRITEYACQLNGGERWRCRGERDDAPPLTRGTPVRVSVGGSDAYVFALGQAVPRAQEPTAA